MLDEMSFSPSLSSSQVYREFMEIETNEYRTIVKFFEEYEQDIYQLKFEEYFDLISTYADALFEIGAYQDHLKNIDEIIEIIVDRNIKFYKGKDVFFDTIFKKAASHYNLHQYEKAEHILKELIKIDPTDKLTIRFLKKCIRHKYPPYLKNTRGLSVLTFLITAVIISIELIYIRSLYPIYEDQAELLRNGLFIIGWIILLSGEAIHYFRVSKVVDEFTQKMKLKK